jgi:hypothetical protein
VAADAELQDSVVHESPSLQSAAMVQQAPVRAWTQTW